MQRSLRLRSSQVSNPRLFCDARFARPSGVSGSRPLAGTLINDVRFVAFPRSHQNWLYASSTSSDAESWPRRSAVARSDEALFISAISSAVRNSRSPYRSGRSSGVIVPKFHVPCRSGSPHGVFGQEAAAVGDWDWPTIALDVSIATTAMVIASRPAPQIHRRDIRSSGCLTRHANGHVLPGEQRAIAGDRAK